MSLAFSGVSSWGRDVAILRNGNSIDHERRETLGPVTRLYLSSGYLDIPTDQIERFETEADPPELPKASDSPEPVRSLQPSPAPFARPEPIASGTRAPALLDRESLQLAKGASDRHPLLLEQKAWNIDPDFINSVIRAESGFNSRAVSKKGAQGLMQLMPRTASKMGVSNAFDANANVEGGTKYLGGLLEKYLSSCSASGSPSSYESCQTDAVWKALAAYNAGPKRVDQYRGIPPYAETRAYIARIIRDYNRKKLAENPALANRQKAASRNSPHAPKTAAKTYSRKTEAKSFPRTAETASRPTSSPVN
ncbi:MAG: lytic transglycosylase domain-containing protein [Acidobacteria bacterium]|nr:lytic transglycosylase domain-containing protein [Acidobacteriota bacterium]